MSSPYISICLCFFLVGLVLSDNEFYTNTWVIEVPSGVDDARKIAREHSFVFHGEVPGLPGHFELEHKLSSKRSAESNADVHLELSSRAEVTYTAQQVAKVRKKRGYVYTPASDPKYGAEWFLHNPGGGVTFQGFDLNVEPSWKMGVTGRGVVVSILDDGIERDHPDLIANYDPEGSYDVNGKDPDPMPRYDYSNENNHGTRCAGEVAAAKNNICSVGVAHNSKIGGVRMLDGSVTDVVEGSALGFRQDHIDIYSSSWGPDDDGQTIDGPGPLARKSFLHGVTTGRGGKGSIFVWASGNGGTAGDSCSCDGYVVSPYTIAVGAAAEDGTRPWYSEQCPAQLAVTPSSGSYKHRKIVTSDLRHKCTSSHTGTSAAAPLAAGVIALALEANPSLTWRDVQHVIVLTSSKDHLVTEWQVNGAGLQFSHDFGFGMMDAAAIVNRALSWTTVPERISCTATAPRLSNLMKFTVPESCRVTYLEHVVLTLSVAVQGSRGQLRVTLGSPLGTQSKLLPARPRDHKVENLDRWPFLTVATWGEKPQGEWTLHVEGDGGAGGGVTAAELEVFGTEGTPVSVQRTTRECHQLCRGQCSGPGPSDCDDCHHLRVFSSRECVDACPPATFLAEGVCYPCPGLGCSACERHACSACAAGLTLTEQGSCQCGTGQFQSLERGEVLCQSCHSSCLACTGPLAHNCTLCPASLSLVNGSCQPLPPIPQSATDTDMPVHSSTQPATSSNQSPIQSVTNGNQSPIQSVTNGNQSPIQSVANSNPSLSQTTSISPEASSTAIEDDSYVVADVGHVALGTVLFSLGVLAVVGAVVGLTVLALRVGSRKYKRYHPVRKEDSVGGYWDSDEEIIHQL